MKVISDTPENLLGAAKPTGTEMIPRKSSLPQHREALWHGGWGGPVSQVGQTMKDGTALHENNSVLLKDRR